MVEIEDDRKLYVEVVLVSYCVLALCALCTSCIQSTDVALVGIYSAVLWDRRIAQEVPGDELGDEFKGYVFKITGGTDKQGFPMKQGVLVPHRVRLLLGKGMLIVEHDISPIQQHTTNLKESTLAKRRSIAHYKMRSTHDSIYER
jgi:hypothetical protein